ncbi:MAG: hypothetical protein K6G11_00600, partial [Lachnospiraceae bacterium]|nr:hypothetical protein [Lachnospiraceae bacterium]
MKGLKTVLTPFAPDQSGSVAVLYEYGGLIVILDAGGCTGNICGFDEPRWTVKKSMIMSAALRDMDAILGRDEALVKKTVKAAEQLKPNFIAVIGTPVPAVIGTDFRGIVNLLKKKTGMENVFGIETFGMKYYDEGASKSYMALVSEYFAGLNSSKYIGIFGATPLDISKEELDYIKSRIQAEEGLDSTENIISFGMDCDYKDFSKLSGLYKNYVISISGLKACRKLKDDFEIDYVLENYSAENYVDKALELINTSKAVLGKIPKVLIVSEQIFANSLRNLILKSGFSDEIEIINATFFMKDKEISETCDLKLKDEDDFENVVVNENIDVVIGDPVLKDILSIKQLESLEWLSIKHFAVSG